MAREKEIIFFLIIFLYSVTSSAQNRADFLVVENPTNLVIWNKFKQPITESEKILFNKYQPLLITEQNGLLSDGVRAYTEIELNNNKYYLLKELNGNYYNYNKAGLIKLYKDKRYFYDSLKIINPEKNKLFSVDNKNKLSLNKNEVIVRIFEDKSIFYVKIKNNYGWLKLGELNKDYTLLKKNGLKNLKLSKEDIEKIKKVFQYSNSLLNKTYKDLNKFNNKNLIAPKWQLDIKETRVVATLSNSFTKFNDSNKRLVNRLESLLLGSELKVRLNKNNITISY